MHTYEAKQAVCPSTIFCSDNKVYYELVVLTHAKPKQQSMQINKHADKMVYTNIMQHNQENVSLCLMVITLSC